MPITASINRHPEAESQSETSNSEEMKATLDLASDRQCRIGQGHCTHHTGGLGRGSNSRSRNSVADHFARPSLRNPVTQHWSQARDSKALAKAPQQEAVSA
jgi:hypothetical protein